MSLFTVNVCCHACKNVDFRGVSEQWKRIDYFIASAGSCNLKGIVKLVVTKKHLSPHIFITTLKCAQWVLF